MADQPDPAAANDDVPPDDPSTWSPARIEAERQAAARDANIAFVRAQPLWWQMQLFRDMGLAPPPTELDRARDRQALRSVMLKIGEKLGGGG